MYVFYNYYLHELVAKFAMTHHKYDTLDLFTAYSLLYNNTITDLPYSEG